MGYPTYQGSGPLNHYPTYPNSGPLIHMPRVPDGTLSDGPGHYPGGPPMVMDEIPRVVDPFGIYRRRAPRPSGGDPNLGNSGVFKLPHFPGQSPGGMMNLPYFSGADMNDIQLLAGGFRPGGYGAIPGGQSPYRFGPYLPFRGGEKKEEQTPFVPIPRV